MRKTRKEKALCLTSLAAWWHRVEKEERKFFREVTKESQSKYEDKLKKEKKQREKENFIKKFFPEYSSSPGGTQRLFPDRIPPPPATEGGMEKTMAKISKHFSANFSRPKIIFKNSDSCKVPQNDGKNDKKTSFGLDGGSTVTKSTPKPTNHRRGQGPGE